jgi:PiT family inorganic phosphate transporter
VQSRKVAHTVSQRITTLNPGQGFTANLVTALLVIGASRMGVPVSTTHVSCGCIFGISAANGVRRWRTIGLFLLTWLTTLPLGLALGAGSLSLIRLMGI